MNPTIALRLISIAVILTAWCYGLRAQAQHSAAPNIEQEFLDAIKKGNSARVGELLKQSPALINAQAKSGATPVLFAVYTRHPEIAETLLATGIEPDIFESAALGKVERVRELLKRNPQLVKAFSSDGWTALHLNFGNEEIVKLTLDSGADINAVSHNLFKATPLQGAAAMQNIGLARLLIAHGANVNCRGAEGGTPLHESAAQGQIELAKVLLDHGAEVNAKDDQGKTPLTLALENKKTDMAKFLRAHKAAQ